MKLWMGVVRDDSAGELLVWGRTQAEATDAARLRVGEEPKTRRIVRIRSVDIMPTKQGLVAWLNTNFTTNNG